MLTPTTGPIDRYVSGTPLYRQLASFLRQRIRDGEFPEGTELPSERLISEEYNLGRDTVRDAIAVLCGEGLVDTQRGYRTKVRIHRPTTEHHVPPDARITARMPSAEERARYQMPAGVPLLMVQIGGETSAYAADRVVVVSGLLDLQE